MKSILLVGLGGMIGSMLRYATTLIFPNIPQAWVIMFINILGSFLLGAIFGMSNHYSWLNPDWKLFFATGVCGGFTTFSTFSYNNLEWIEQGKYAALVAYGLGSIIFGWLAVWLGYKLFA